MHLMLWKTQDAHSGGCMAEKLARLIQVLGRNQFGVCQHLRGNGRKSHTCNLPRYALMSSVTSMNDLFIRYTLSDHMDAT